MVRSNLGAVRLPLLGAAVFASFAVSLSAQVVEKGRTFADLTASHPCDTGQTNRIARVTDCDAADNIGDGGGAFQCWAICDGSAPWVAQAIGGGGGLPGADEVTESMLKSVNAATDEYVLTYESTVGDFEWQPAATGTIGGSLGATDNVAVCTDGTGGSTVGPCTGQAIFPSGTGAAPGIALSGSLNAGIHLAVGAAYFSIGGTSVVRLSSDAVRWVSGADVGWTSSTTDTETTATDTGMKRNAAGVIKVTNGGTGIRGFLGGGAAVASATAMPVPTGRVFHVTGTTDITSITSTNFQSGACVTLIFDGILTFTDGSNLVLAGNFVTTADDTISLCYDGTSWFETSRSVN